MKYTIEQLNFVVPAISIGFLIIITSINIYFKIRRRFSALVNCWFCNENTKIPYDDINKWTCPKCEQYNGFTEDGDYNCDIPEQRSARLNKWKTSSFTSMNGSFIGERTTPANGLCEPCNRNQELKVQQLASFEPENDAYFDEEIEEYRAKLEQAYRLCPRCERHLKRTLNKVKTNILGSKLKQIGTKGLQAFNLHVNEANTKAIVHKKRLIFARIALTALILISLLQFCTITNQITITKAKLDSIFNASTTKLILTVLSYISAVKIMLWQLIEDVIALPYVSFAVTSVQVFINYLYVYISGDFWNMLNTKVTELIDVDMADSQTNPISSALTINIAGCFLSIFLVFLFGLEWGPVLLLLLWTFSMIMPNETPNTLDNAEALLLNVVQLTLVWLTMVLSTINFFILPGKSSQKSNSSFHRIDSEINSDVSDDSDVESELNTSLRSNMSASSYRTSGWNDTKVLNSTISFNPLHRRSYAASQSILSPKPASEMNATFTSKDIYRRSSHMDLTHDKLNSIAAPLKPAQSNDIFGRRHCPSVMSFYSLNKTFDNATESLRPSSRISMYDIPNDFESGITRLSISGEKQFNATRQSSCFGSADPFGDALRLRKSVLTPSRLSLTEAHQSSWLAGGFWNSTSPQKKYPHHVNNFKIDQHTTTTVTKEVFPIISRASSKSSGFESRENSLCDDNESDRKLPFSEPTSLTQSAKMPTDLIKPQPQRPAIHFNGMNGRPCLQPPSPVKFISTTTADAFSNTFIDRQNTSPSFSTLSQTFGQFSLQQPINQSPAEFQNHLNHLNDDDPFRVNLNQLNRTSRSLPMPHFQRGSLIKLRDTANDCVR